ncbi:MGH1-like glycoside hydrolase domain-containing protein [Kordiimonas marina]|uniref:MGH1-like glycoside hydrolase domain-containing protein n=1 Tax=Kordiimonas marina TaxID=2872312 RepID=UPI001FF551CB|nr:trehalase family glycosidase [Kordiimonas marina]MCJ9430472.1 hypothetical protein [Kordiimonas marina]
MTDRSILDRAAQDILQANDRGGYTVPNGQVYPFQWNWDSAFTALGFATFDRDRAWTEIETLFSAQWDDGFMAHIVFWRDDEGYFPGPGVWGTNKKIATSGITQPPVAASVVRWLYESAVTEDEKARAAALYPKLAAWHDWFEDVRDPDNKGLVVSVHPWESGRDNSPEWDEPAAAVDISGVEPYVRRDTSHLDASMRPTKLDYDRYLAMVQYGRDCGWDHKKIATEGPFRVVDVSMTMILIRANRDLLALAEALGHDADAEKLRARIANAEKGVAWLWNDEVGAYCSRDMITGKSSGMITSASFLGFYAGVVSTSQRSLLIGHLERIGRKISYMVPSLDPDHKEFDPIRYWRGPCWAVVNFLVATGLANEGLNDWAERVRLDTGALIEKTGFYEAFCPVTGRGTGGGDFTWTAAMWLHWAGRTGADQAQ